MILNYSSFAFSPPHTTHQTPNGWLLCHGSIHRVSWIVVLAISLILLLWLQPIGGAAMPVAARRESITSCFPSGSDDSGCSCSPEPIEEDSCGVSITTACYENCDDILDLCYNPCVQLQETCLNSCLMNVTNSDACRCGCLENAYDCENLCAMEFNTCTCRCTSVNVPTLSPGIDGNGSSTSIDRNGSSTGIDRNGSSSGTSGSSGSSTSGSFLGHAAAIRTLTAAGLAVVLWYM